LGVEYKDLDQKMIKAIIVESNKNNRGNYQGVDELGFLTHYGLYQNGSFLNACVVLFANKPARFIPQIRVRLTEYAEEKTDKNLLRDEIFDGNLFTILDDLERYINNLGIRSVFDKNQWKRIDFKFPIKALKEGIINALMHRDYSSLSSGVAISVYPDKFIISNSGHLPDDLKVGDLKKNHRSHTVNPDIAHIVFLKGLIDKLGRGTLKLLEDCKKEGLKEPSWEDSNDGITLTFNGPRALPFKKDRSKIEGVIEGVKLFSLCILEDSIFDGLRDSARVFIRMIIERIRTNPGDNIAFFSRLICKSYSTTERYIRLLKSANLIEFKGSSKTGGYKLADKAMQLIK
jgi:ATP-dependent DNA helicase RecG